MLTGFTHLLLYMLQWLPTSCIALLDINEYKHYDTSNNFSSASSSGQEVSEEEDAGCMEPACLYAVEEENWDSLWMPTGIPDHV